jgi:hypothetical protein
LNQIKKIIVLVITVVVLNVVGRAWDTIRAKVDPSFAAEVKHEEIATNLERALYEYRAAHGADPAELPALVEAGFLQSTDLMDEWGRALDSQVVGGELMVTSRGKDGVADTEDDWILGR